MSESTIGTEFPALAWFEIYGGALVAAQVASYGIYGGALLAAQVSSAIAATAATLPSGAAGLVGLTDAALITTSICNPIAFFHEAELWQGVAEHAGDWSSMTRVITKFGDAWKGPAADAFVDFVRDGLIPVFPLLKSLATSERDLLLAAGYNILGAIAAVIVPTLSLVVVALALASSAGPSFGLTLAAQWPATTAWVTVILGGVLYAIKVHQDLSSLLTAVGDKANELSAKVNYKAKDLGNNALKPPATALPPLGADITTLGQMADSFTPEKE